MIPRYTRPKMAGIWTDENRFKVMLEVEILACEAMVKLGKVYGNLMVDLSTTNEKLARRARGIVQEVTGVDTARADHLLRAAGGSAKLAIVMQLRDLDAATARTTLEAADGQLRRVIESHSED